MVKCEIFYDQKEAETCLAQHPGAEISARPGRPIRIHGEWMYPIPEDRPSWTVWWEEKQEDGQG